ncbi:hypothetical protein PG911_17735 [Tenacibaculum ovolyticum]|uniref:hypothetical protein n=1 Tax=Tenacibaculum ovolyticum TaxID=104270 RepID=UPI0007ED6150|nr:hypothetical protein [Tenacibaculum ovolyticum]WBX76444.1 hypothetical protein PG911_17735 [Tenacibaculum ovolyticum]
MYKKITLFVLLIISVGASAQCAMCKAVVEGGNEAVAEGVNNGITYLMVFPYILVGVLSYFIYRHKKTSKN